VKTFSVQVKPYSCQMHQHKTDRLFPNSRQTQTPPDPTTGAIIASFVFLASSVATVRTWFQFLPHRTNGATVKSSVTDIDFYISSRSSVWTRLYNVYNTKIRHLIRINFALRKFISLRFILKSSCHQLSGLTRRDGARRLMASSEYISYVIRDVVK
jgi:hypothetical protein